MNKDSNSRDSLTRSDYQQENKGTSILREIASTLVYILVITGIFLLIQHFFFVLVSVDGQSMYPTLEHNDRLVLNKVSDIERFDIVVFPAPDEPDKQYIKRVIGVPGDEVEYREDVLYLNGKQVDEPYLEHYQEGEFFSTYVTGNFDLESLVGTPTVPKGHYFVLGDNRLNSRDSRSFGFIDEETITGETSFQVWPLSEFGFIE